MYIAAGKTCIEARSIKRAGILTGEAEQRLILTVDPKLLQ